ncbi:MAG: 1,4-alpha-glucan branching protein GlgB [Ornithinimicrobium sp.]
MSDQTGDGAAPDQVDRDPHLGNHLGDATQSALGLDIIELLTSWMPDQRWFAGKGRRPALREIGAITLARRGAEDADGLAVLEVRTHLVLDESSSGDGGGTLYQVPLTYRRHPRPELLDALLTSTATHHIYDGTHDPAYVQAVLDLISTDDTVRSQDSVGEVSVHGVGFHHTDRSPDTDGDRDSSAVEVTRAAVLSGEQSNTSIIVQTRPLGEDDAEEVSRPSIIKIFRVLHHGANPDVVVQGALSRAGSRLVPSPLGHLEGSWSRESVSGSGHLAFAQEFLTGVQDAWRTALVAAQHDTDFTARAFALGEATAEMHSTLAHTMGSAAADDERKAALVQQWHQRSNEALLEVPDLHRFADGIAGVFARAAESIWPPLQRVHGDYHLGQVLDAPERGWVLLDFEGEPLRPLAQRSLPDLALRDVAGMLRSFDYAAGSIDLEQEVDRSHWAKAVRAAFLDGYSAAIGEDPRLQPDLLSALELDKALYEVVYEARNRPSWASIPIGAISRLMQASQPDAPHTHGSAPHEPDLTDPTQETTVSTSTGPKAKPLPMDEVEQLIRGQHGNPHALLGAHPHDGGVTVRALRPMAERVELLLADGERVPMEHEMHGIFTAVLDTETVTDYRLEVAWGDGVAHRQDDPYRFLPTLGEIDQHLINEGRHEQLWTVLGAHTRRYEGPLGEVLGTSFAVWAPNARSINLVGDFNHWDNSSLPMRALATSGIWELFVPDVGVGSRYKFDITGPDGSRTSKADPMARAAEVAPASASIVTESVHQWHDSTWVQRRDRTPAVTSPMSVYEVHLASWRQGLSYRELASQLVDYVSELGFTHVEFMPVMQHPFGPSWGYHVTGYYAADARLGGPEDLKFLIDALHQADIGVILDWVPGHFATDPWALARFDGTPLYEHPDPRKGWHSEWGSYVFDFGRPQVRNFLVANALFWLEEFHADGLRVDGVASILYLDYSREEGEWIPNEYGGNENLDAVRMLQETNATAYRRHPGVTIIAEESTSWPGVTRPTDQDGLGFGFKWNMGWMNDSLDYMAKDPIYRQHHHHQLTFSLVYAFSENFVLPISHDEVVHGKGSLLRKMPGDRWKQLANLRAFLAFMWSHPGKQLLFMGSEFAQESEWADGRSLDWWLLNQPDHAGVAHLVRDLNTAYRANPALWQLDHTNEGFQWLDADDAEGNTFSYLRRGTADESGHRSTLVAIANFGDGGREVHVGLPHGGTWRETLNTDATTYGGSGVGNMGRVQASDEPRHGQSHSARVMAPPLGVLWLTPMNDSTESATSTQEGH